MVVVAVAQGVDKENAFFNHLEVSFKPLHLHSDGNSLSSDDCRLLVPYVTKVGFNQFLSH